MKISKYRWGLYSLQAFDIPVVGPALFYLILPVVEHFKGNQEAVAYTKTYTREWDSIRVVLPENLYEQSFEEETSIRSFMIKDHKNKRRMIYSSDDIYYISQYKKYFEFIWIIGIDIFTGLYGRQYDAAGIQCQLVRPEMVPSVYVNRKQWRDKSYGTTEKPVPVFLHRIIVGDDIEERNKRIWKKDSLYPKGYFVEHYLPPHAVRRMRNTPDFINRKFVDYSFVISCPKMSLTDC